MSFMCLTHRASMFEFFHAKLALSKTEDFRSIAWIPNEYRGALASMDHISVAVAYNNFIGYTCCMHSVIQRPDHVTPAMVRESFRYPFVELKMKVIFALVDSSNEKALNFDRKLGFTEVARYTDAGLDGDLVLLHLKEEDCRWIRKEKRGQEIQSSAA